MKVTDKTNSIIEKELELMSYTTRVPYYPLDVENGLVPDSVLEEIKGW